MHRRIECGFTLIELMIILAVAAIVLGIGIPGLQSLVQSQQISAAANNLLAGINLTRSEAIQRGARVDIVPAGDAHDWSRGWVIFIDENGDQRRDPGEQTIFSQGPVAARIVIKARFTDSSRQYVAYQGSGRTRTNANPQSPQFGSFLLTLGDHQRKVSINMLGRARVCNPVTQKNSC